ncbi:PDDEXK nuclease domain-containing protein [Mucilaginibacter sp. KACC 22773]|uniref:PDDEXK nuclease domain-containing protein n=1 Tax=Mucilaginibacter sp. KACC 22773 TaxID=3025671 RepID=UPI0023657A56|nr:PDDEXK nuclease domain-containing protein [Mucilaginibacter sp. KACC 22773]WDF79051.1 PDDEXK nuclease domain-containing protein [Mucilaginibacter sp. KACC 22773]
MDNDQSYLSLLSKLKTDIADARLKVAFTVNEQLLELYWKIGNNIQNQRNNEGWGTKIIDKLSNDLKQSFPDMKGISPRNLKYMQSFAEAYPLFLQAPLAKLESTSSILQVPLAKLPWYHHITLLDKVKDGNERLFYIEQSVKNGWSRNMLVNQVESNLYLRKGKAVTNFSTTLPPSQSDLAKEIFKDPYKFDFLNLADNHFEKELEDGLVGHMTKFLLELGNGFSYVGRQYPLEIGGEDFYIDLLFYHLRLRCYIVIELKAGKFIPEFAGKLNFYLNAVDGILKHQHDQPTIGILICKEKNKIVAEYALKGLEKPIGVSEYNLTKAIPSNLKGSLPSIAEIEKNLK